jgi:hypothetical protein
MIPEYFFIVVCLAGLAFTVRTVIETVLIIQDYRKERSLEQ